MTEAPGRPPHANATRAGVFISYSRADRTALDSVMRHLAVVERLGHRVWTDRDIKPGQHWHTEISLALSRASIAILIVTPAFVASEYITSHELPSLLQAAQDDGLTIFWIPWHAADISEFAQFQAAYPPQTPLATVPRAKREQALVAIVGKLKALLGSPPSQARGGDGAQARPASATAFRLELTDEMTLPLDEREAVVAMDEILYAARTAELSIEVEIPALTAARQELARLEAGAPLTIEERERRVRLRKEFQPAPGFPRDVFLSGVLTSLVRHVPEFSPSIRTGADLLECVRATIGYRRYLRDVVFDCFRRQRSWSVQFEAPHAVADAIASDRSTEVKYLTCDMIELYAAEFPTDVRRGRIIPALLWYGGLGLNGASLDNPELFDLSLLRVGRS